jgi:hypothetical protein
VNGTTAAPTRINITKAERSCSIVGCAVKHSGRGWCGRHYMRWYRYGHPLAMVVREPRVLPEPAQVVAECQDAHSELVELVRAGANDGREARS